MQKPAWSKDARTGPMRNYMDLRIFACEGLVCIVDERPGQKEGEYTVLTPADLKERVQALNIPYRNQTRAQLPKRQRDELDKQIRGSQNCMESIKEAIYMGDPSDPAVQSFWSRHRRSTAIKFKFSAGADKAGYPTLPDLKFNDGTSVPIGEPDVANYHIHKPPRKKRQGQIIL